MTATSNLQTLSIIDCSSMTNFQARLPSIYKQIEEDGFAIVQTWDTSVNTLREISLFFGYIKNHPNADETGINTLVTEYVVNDDANNSPSFREYHYGYTDELALHTDASHIDGVAFIDGKVVRIAPPSLFLLQCVRPATEGGANFLVDGQEILQQLWNDEPEHARVITQPRSVSLCKAKYFSTYCPLFEKLSSGRLRVRFREDTMYIEPWAYSSVKYVIDNYFLNHKFRKHHLLTEGQIMIVDNHRMLHGRKAIISHDINNPRILNKAWIWDDSTDEVLRLVNEDPDEQHFQAYNVYLPKNFEAGHKRIRPLEIGIKLKSEILKK